MCSEQILKLPHNPARPSISERAFSEIYISEILIKLDFLMNKIVHAQFLVYFYKMLQRLHVWRQPSVA